MELEAWMLGDITEEEPADQAVSDVRIPPLDGQGPLWLQIRRSMAMAILTGEWPAGTRVPTEVFLTDYYTTSRMTVNKAVQSLAGEGLVERRPKLGTVVTARARERPVFEIWDAADTVRRSGGRYDYRLIECAMLADTFPVRSEIAVENGTPVIRILCLHLADGVPFQLEERLINVDAAPEITSQPLDDVSPGQWLLANVPWTEARHTVSARGATPMIAKHLALDEGDACLVVERRTWNGPVPVTLGRFWYAGDNHSLEGQFRPSW